jgi:hypothetical protein
MLASTNEQAQSPAARRVEIMAAARAAAGVLVSFDPAKLRFSLGTSITDVRIPVHVAPDAGAIVSAAAGELAMLLATHHQHFVPADELDRVYLSEGYASLPAPAPTLGPSGGGADLRVAAQLGAAGHPALTGGILCAWMGPGGRGRSLTALFIQALQQALAEAEESRLGEETPLIVAMALFDELLRAEGRVREVMPGPPLDRYLRSATSIGLWIAAWTGLGRVWRDAGRSPRDPLSLKVEAVLSPWLLLGGGVPSLGGATLYGCELSAAVPRGEEMVARLAQGADPDSVVGDLAHTLTADEDLSRRAEGAVAVARLRELLLAGVVQAEAAGRGGGMSALREVYSAPGALASACAEDGARLQLAARVEAAALMGGKAGAPLEEVARALRAWRRKEPASCVALTREEACAEYAMAAGAVACDAALERMVGRARRAIVTRTGAEAEGGLEAEWDQGRLYRISARAGPILRSTEQRPLGHLFADVKDFTRRTALLGPAAMAEFLRTEFYRPILEAAKGFFVGMPHLADRGGIALNNLVGDAISFSGDIEALVALSTEIRRLLVSYQVRLAREISSEAMARQLSALSARFESELQGAARAASEARAARAPAARLQQLEEHEARLREERDRAVARARGGALEAGVFLSFGPAPVTVLIDDDVFGRNRVAIAEKINESARGTARAASARARADAALASERASRGNPDLQHAWSVFVGPPLSIAIPPELERAAVAAAAVGDLPTALRALAGPVRQAVERAASGSGDEPGDIYNSGVALSEEALTSFLHAAKDSRQVRRVDLDGKEIPSELTARWFYGASPLELVVTFSLDGRPAELFRRAGLASFKGLGGVPVWELAAGEGGPAELVKHFAARWFNAGR